MFGSVVYWCYNKKIYEHQNRRKYQIKNSKSLPHKFYGILVANVVNIQKASKHIMNKRDENAQDRENFHPMQNMHFTFVWFNYMIRYGNKDNNGCHDCDSLKRVDPKCCSNCQQNSLI